MDFEMVQELRSRTKAIGWMYLADLLFVGCFFAVMFMFADRVHPALQIPYHIFNIIVGLILTIRSPFNPKKRIFQTILFILKADKSCYHPICNILTQQPKLKSDLIK